MSEKSKSKQNSIQQIRAILENKNQKQPLSFNLLKNTIEFS